ncbi:nitrilase-related carbon-nitrogen hydrolase [Ochrobactrum sp. MYb379]|uniref:nitrilase-related carbon-nitrogen hydrolase n=1 Tax=Ochrobactrum sp. MYb379 TaxID=2745275 RepID=UPI0030B58913
MRSLETDHAQCLTSKTNKPYSSHRSSDIKSLRRSLYGPGDPHWRTFSQLPKEDKTVIVLPESSLGFWTPILGKFWNKQLKGTSITVIAGAAVIEPDGYDNVMVANDARSGPILYHERIPVPVSMWRPWEHWFGLAGGARASFFANSAVDVAGKRIAPLICYEQLILWPILQSMLQQPDVIVPMGNGWWTTGSNIVAFQRASAKAWTELVGIPLVISFNT